jgi:hypothetical protein
LKIVDFFGLDCYMRHGKNHFHIDATSGLRVPSEDDDTPPVILSEVQKNMAAAGCVANTLPCGIASLPATINDPGRF